MLKQKLLGAVPILQSSQNPEEVSATVKGVLISLIPLLSMLLQQFGVTAEWLNALVNALFGVVGSVIMVWGVIRKFKK